MKALKIEPDGQTEIVEITGTVEEQNDRIWEILGGYFDIVRMHDALVLVNDEGLLDGLPINLKAMHISRYPMLVGTALIVGIEDSEDGEVFGDCPDYYIRKYA